MFVTFKALLKFVNLVSHSAASIFGLHLNIYWMIYCNEWYKYPNHHSSIYDEQYYCSSSYSSFCIRLFCFLFMIAYNFVGLLYNFVANDFEYEGENIDTCLYFKTAINSFNHYEYNCNRAKRYKLL